MCFIIHLSIRFYKALILWNSLHRIKTNNNEKGENAYYRLLIVDINMKRNVFITLGLAALMGVGVAAGFSAHREARVAKADAPVSDATIYFDVVDLHSSWYDASAHTKVWCYGHASEADTWAVVTRVGETDYYSFVLPAGYSTFKIARTNPDENAWWNETVAVGYSSSVNKIKVLNEKDGESHYKVNQSFIYENAIAKDDKIYVTIDSKDYDWFSASAASYIYMWNDRNGETKILSTTRISSTSTTVVGQLDAAFTATGFKAIRHNPASTFTGTFDSNVWNQGANVQFTSENASARAVIDRTRTGQWNYTDGFEVVSASYFAKAFSYYFLEATGDYCNTEVSSETQTALRSAFDAFEALQSGTKAAFYTGETEHKADDWRSSDARVDATKEARSKYWHMVNATNHKLGAAYTDFLGVKANIAATNNYSLVAEGSNYNATLIIVVISSLVLLSVAGVVIIRKRKENN